ncbi:hypothetical protein VPH35_132426 [Triticum aestivum]
MPSFTGVSIVDGEQCCCEASAVVDAGSADSGYHLLVVRGYSPSPPIISDVFIIGGHCWYIEYYPNGENPDCGDFISLYVTNYDNSLKEPLETKFGFSFIDQVEKQTPMYIHAAGKTCRFTDGHCSWGTDKFVRRDALERSSDLKGDCFTVWCDVMVIRKDPKAEDAGGHDTKMLLSDIDQHFNILLQTKVGADVTFEVSGETFAAHRCVLAARSMVFMAQLFGPMKETSAVIQIKDMEAKVFKALLSFIYTDSFPVMEKDSMEEDAMIEVTEDGQEKEALVAADRYDVQRLKCICEKQLSENIGVSTVMSSLALAEQHHCQGLKEACLKFIQVQSPSCLQTVMATNGWDHVVSTYPSVLKELFLKFASSQ